MMALKCSRNIIVIVVVVVVVVVQYCFFLARLWGIEQFFYPPLNIFLLHTTLKISSNEMKRNAKLGFTIQ
jgi:hypothetical protein